MCSVLSQNRDVQQTKVLGNQNEKILLINHHFINTANIEALMICLANAGLFDFSL